MASRTRSRTSQQGQKSEEFQAKLTASYSVTRRNAHTTTKSIKQETIQDAKPSTTKTTTRSKRIKKEVESVLPSEHPTSAITQPPALDSPPRRPRKTPTPPSSPQQEVQTTAVRRLFTNTDKSKEQMKSATAEFPFGMVEKKITQKVRTIADLQSRLAAANPALTKVHEQIMANAAKQVEEHAELLRSPTKVAASVSSPIKKVAPLFTSPPKRLPPIKITREEMGTSSNTPHYVLPTHRTPAKVKDEEEEQKQKEIFGKSQLARLTEEVKNSAEIKLPRKYLQLLEKFECHDRIISIFFGRSMKCESNTVFKNVMANLKMDFNRKHLAQIISVYPKSYTLSLGKILKISGGASGESELIINPNLSEDLIGFLNPESPQRALMEAPLPKVQPGPCVSPMKSPRKKCAVPVPREPEINMAPKLEGWRMLCRKYVMRHFLARKVIDCHALFMKKIEGIASEFKRFHPYFLERMEEECPDIEPAPLPEPPNRGANAVNVADFMKSVKEPETAVDIAIKELKNGAEDSVSRNIPLSPKKFAQQQAAKPAGTMSLLERIRAKEAAKKALEDKRDPEAERRYYRLNLLHEKIMRPLLLMFIRGQCRSIDLQKVIDKIEATVKSPKNELKESLELLCSLTSANVAQIIEVCGTKYIQIEKTAHEQLREIVKSSFEAAPKPTIVFASKGR